MGLLHSRLIKPNDSSSSTTKLSRSSVVIQKKKKTGLSKSSSTVDMLRAVLTAGTVRPLPGLATASMAVQVNWGDGCWFVTESTAFYLMGVSYLLTNVRFDANVREFDSFEEKILVEYNDGICEWVHADECRAVTSGDSHGGDRSVSETIFNEDRKSLSTLSKVVGAQSSKLMKNAEVAT